MEFRVLPPVRMKGKQYLVPLFQPTGRMHRHAVVQTTTGEPIDTWPNWTYKEMLHQLFFPGYEYRPPNVSEAKIWTDLPVRCGPLFPWEYIEPWDPALQPTIDLGGVIVLQGNETDGTTELVNYMAQLGRSLDRYFFLCSNMPDSIYVNIANVPMLAWSKLCTEMVEAWRSSAGRQRKGYATYDGDSSVYGLTKELIHPLFHWRLKEMKSLIHGLVLPSEVPQNHFMDSIEAFSSVPSSSGLQSNNNYDSWTPPGNQLDKNCYGDKRFSNSLLSHDLRGEMFHDNPLGKGFHQRYFQWYLSPATDQNHESLAPLICSLVNGFSMYNPCIVCLHVRSGTSLFSSMDDESWKIARLLARTAMMRRRRKIELDSKELKKWRKNHSRQCVWCRGTWEPYRRLSKEMVHPQWTSCCRPLPSKYFPPFVFILVCSDSPYPIPEKQEILHYAQESNGFINILKLTPLETASYFAHCLSVTPQSLPNELVEYIYRVSSGIPKYIYLTAGQLITEQAIRIESSNAYTTTWCKAKDLYRTRVAKRKKNSLRWSCVSGTNIHKDYLCNKAESESTLPFTQSRHGSFLSSYIKREFIHKKHPRTCVVISPSKVTPFCCTVSSPKALFNFACLKVLHLRRKPQTSVFDLRERRGLKRSDSFFKGDVSSTGKHFNTNFSRAIDFCSRYGKEKYANVCIEKDIGIDSSILLPLPLHGKSQDKDDEMDVKKSLSKGRYSQGVNYICPGPECFNTRVAYHCFTPIVPTVFPSSYQKQMEAQVRYDTIQKQESNGLSDQSHWWSTSHSREVNNTRPMKRVKIVKDLKKVPFVSELRAAAISLMERLEPDEQLVAKVASIFPLPFTVFEIQAVYPRTVSSESFQKMLENLLRHEMLEHCDAPTEEELEELHFFPPELMNTYTRKVKTRATKRSDSVISSHDDQSRSSDSTTSGESFVTSAPYLANRWGVDESGKLIYHRFSSIAFQHVVAELIMSNERMFLAKLSRKVIFFRRLYGFNHLIKQINAEAQNVMVHSISTSDHPHQDKTLSDSC